MCVFGFSSRSRMQTNSTMFDDTDSAPQIELSEEEKPNIDIPLNNLWKGGCNRLHNLFPPVYQYPFAEWIPNSIFYSDYKIRLNSFGNWPKQMRPTKSEFVKSGFFYKGTGDSVECFFVVLVCMTGKPRTTQ